jgi:hypothetical protein
MRISREPLLLDSHLGQSHACVRGSECLKTRMCAKE